MTTENRVLCAGLFKFSPEVSEETLTALAQSWADDPNFERLYTRGCSKTQSAIGFEYRLPEGSDNHSKFFYKMTDQLKRRFGNDFCGWDVSTPCTIIK